MKIMTTIRKALLLQGIPLLFLIPGCSTLDKVSVPVVCGPNSTSIVMNHKTPQFSDDLDKASLIKGLDKSTLFWQKQPSDKITNFCGKRYSTEQMLESFKLLRDIIENVPPDQLNRQIKDNFDICQANNSGRTLVTGYYQPVLQGSLEKRPPFIYPLYALPKDLHVVKSNNGSNKKGDVGRLVDGQFTPYWSRAEIEDKLLLHGQELVYLADPVQAFFLHVQGSGLIQFADGSSRAILFAGSNGRAYSSIGKLLAEEGQISLAEMSLAKIQTYLYEHLDEQKRILHYNNRYIFFRWGDPNGNPTVVGSMGEELIAGRSAAFDKSCFPAGIPAFLETQIPVFKENKIIKWQPLRRFVINHDSGSAIKGPGRIDLFWGLGAEAEKTAGVMKQPGNVYFLVKK